ncbi:hypothetical protein, partial [Conchiformibius steedae]|uniref:hypothetical protein n=1 Tax=Conchiformibius steedae TaxID=153493 RepID=UPI0026F11FE0
WKISTTIFRFNFLAAVQTRMSALLHGFLFFIRFPVLPRASRRFKPKRHDDEKAVSDAVCRVRFGCLLACC